MDIGRSAQAGLANRLLQSVAALVLAAPPATAAGFPPCDPSASSQTVSFVHVTDLHAHYNARPGEPSPYARIRGQYKAVLRDNPYTLFVDGGDDYEKGSLAETLSGGASTREMTRAMGFDVRVMGNHDFAFGAMEALRHSRDARAIVLASNLRYQGKDALAFGAVSYAELQLGCVRVGFLGLVTRPWNERDEPYTGDYPGLKSRYDWAAVAAEVLGKRTRKPDLTVLVSHLGREDDLAVAGKVQGIDLILGGHTHGLTWEPILVGRTRVVESGFYAEYMSRTDATVDLSSRASVSWRYALTRVDNSLPVDLEVDRTAREVAARYMVGQASAAGCACAAADKSSAALAAARAAVRDLGADAAVVDVKTVWDVWPAGPLFGQSFNDAFRIERQPPGTAGFNAFYVAETDGASLGALYDTLDSAQWVYVGPNKPDPSRRYRLALPKRAALHPGSFFSPRVVLRAPTPAAEAWEVLARYARSRLASGLCVDDGCAAPKTR